MNNQVRARFEVLSAQWLRETKHLSLVSKKMEHPAIIEIVAMGYDAVPFIMEALRDQPAHWFIPLTLITKENPVPHGS